MKYERGDVLTLSDNNQYVVVSVFKYEGKDYIYLIDSSNPKNVIFCEYQGEEFAVVEEDELIQKLLKEIAPELQIILEEYNKHANN